MQTPEEKRAYHRAYYDKNREHIKAQMRAHNAANRQRLRAYHAGRRASSGAWISAEKSNPCMDCGGSYPWYAMQFDHRPGTTKSFEVSQSRGRALASIQAERAKCDLVCANCHAIRTYERRAKRVAS